MTILRQDLRYALRGLRTAPGFTAIAALTLGLGIGANAAMVGLFDALLARPPEGVHQPGRLVRIETESAALPGRAPSLDDALSHAQFEALRSRAEGFAGMAAHAATPLGVGEGADLLNEEIILASGDYFQVLGVRPALGRLIQPDDDRGGAANPVAVLSWDYWKRGHGGDPSVLGKQIRVAGQPLTVIGVAQKGFAGTELGRPALWVPLSLSGILGFDEQMMRSPFVSWLRVIGRLAPGAGLEQARATAQSALLAAEEQRQLAPALGMGRGRAPGGARVEIRMERGGGPRPGPAAAPPPRVRLSKLAGAGASAGDQARDGGSPVQLWYLAVTGTVLLIACANVASLLLARGASRQHELAVRLSLGATPRRLGLQLLTESAVLALLGCAAGLVVALAAWRLLPALISMPALPSFLDARTLGITLGLAATTLLLFGVAPVLDLRRPDVRGLLSAAAPSLAQRSHGRMILVAGQFALSMVLLVGAGLFIRSFQNLRTLDLGYDRERLLVVTADTRAAGWTAQREEDFWRSARQRIEKVPGVQGVALGVSVPYLMRLSVPFSATSGALEPGRLVPTQLDHVGPGFFQALGIPILEGRPFTDADRQGSAPVAIVSRSFARETFGAESPVGRCLSHPMGEGCLEVVGVAGDARFGELTDETPAFVYQPLDQRPAAAPGPRVLHVRTEEDPARLAAAIRREMGALDDAPRSVEVRSISELIAPQLAPWKASSLLLGGFGGMGLLLAAVGLYGVVAYLVTRRTREIGIRMALGADRGRILALVLGQALGLVSRGALLGLVLALLGARLAASALYGVGALDPLVYAATAALLGGVALAAALGPARRAMRVDPMVALRAE